MVKIEMELWDIKDKNKMGLWDVKNKNKNNYFMRGTMGYKR